MARSLSLAKCSRTARKAGADCQILNVAPPPFGVTHGVPHPLWWPGESASRVARRVGDTRVSMMMMMIIIQRPGAIIIAESPYRGEGRAGLAKVQEHPASLSSISTARRRCIGEGAFPSAGKNPPSPEFSYTGGHNPGPGPKAEKPCLLPSPVATMAAAQPWGKSLKGPKTHCS